MAESIRKITRGANNADEAKAQAGASSRQLIPKALLSVLAVAINTDEAPEWVELIPAGKFSAVDGRGPFENSDPDSIVAASIARMPQVGLVLDYDHSTDLAAPEGRPAPAAGWLKAFKVENGAIYARIEWTAAAAEAVKAKHYRYVSPVFEHSKDGKVERILRAALTNNPALINLPALASAMMSKTRDEEAAVMSVKEDGKKKMKLSEVMAVLEEAYPDASPEKLMKAAACLVGEDDVDGDDDDGSDGDDEMDAADGDPYKGETEEQMNARQAEEMANCASDDDKAQCAAKHATEKERFAKRNTGLEVHNRNEKSGMSARARKDMTKEELEKAVAKHPMVVSMASEISSLRRERAKQAATEKVDSAIREGRLIPSQRDWAIAYCASDSQAFEKFLGAQPRIIQSGSDSAFTARIGEQKEEFLSQKELSIVQNLGLVGTFGGQDKAFERFVAAKKARLSHNVHLD